MLYLQAINRAVSTMSHKSLESKYYFPLIVPDEINQKPKGSFLAKIALANATIAQKFSFISKAQWLLLIVICGICLGFMTFTLRLT